MSHIISIQQDGEFFLEHSSYFLNNNLIKPDSEPQSKSIISANESPVFTPDTMGDIYVNTEIVLPRLGYEKPQLARVYKRLKDIGCNLISVDQ